MTETPFGRIWSRIVAHAGETFHTITGLEFTYVVRGGTFYPSRTRYGIGREDFRKAFELVPIEGPGKISDLVRGSAYVWAVLHDRRISEGEW